MFIENFLKVIFENVEQFFYASFVFDGFYLFHVPGDFEEWGYFEWEKKNILFIPKANVAIDRDGQCS